MHELKKETFIEMFLMKKFDVVFTSCSLHYSANKDFTLQEKTHKLQMLLIKTDIYTWII